MSSSPVFGQAANNKPIATASVSGTVTLGGEPAPNVMVTLRTTYQNGEPPRTTSKARTGPDGRYQITNLPAGAYGLMPLAPAFVVTSLVRRGISQESGLTVTLNDGEALKDLDFTLGRGGVITGRITGDDGRPIISHQVLLRLVTPKPDPPPKTATGEYPNGVVVAASGGPETTTNRNFLQAMAAQTDDRGVYRFFGLLPGDYVVSAGTDLKVSGPQFYSGPVRTTHYQGVYYPEAETIEAATVVEVDAGGETANIDIKLGKLVYGYQISGRVINAKTGAPVPKVNLYPDRLAADGKNSAGGAQYFNRSTTNERGEFVLAGLAAGRYRINAASNESEGLYFPSVETEIADADVSGLVVKSKSGVSIDGTVVIDNTSNGPLPFRLGELSVSAYTQAEGERTYGNAQLLPDGTFHLAGLSPGKIMVNLFSRVNGLGLRSVERNGITQPGNASPYASNDGLVVDPREGTGSFVLHAAYGNCRLRGEVTRDGEPLPDPSVIRIVIGRVDGVGQSYYQSADIRGRFLLDGLTPGQYRVSVTAFDTSAHNGQFNVQGSATVTVVNGVEASVSVNLRPQGNGQP